jgi:hypothetical protein
MTTHHCWTLRNGTTLLYVEWGQAYGTIFSSDCQMRQGPPVTLTLNLDRNFRSSTRAGTYLHARALAEEQFRDLRLVQISDDHIISGLQFLIQHTEDPSSPWRLRLKVQGREHEFTAEPEFRPSGHDHDLLLLRVAGASGSTGGEHANAAALARSRFPALALSTASEDDALGRG